MKRPDPRSFLFDVQRACELITEIVGEAVSQMLKLFPEMQEELPQAPRIISFRNHLIHGYASVSNQVVWGILQSHVPELAAKVRELLAKQPPDEGS